MYLKNLKLYNFRSYDTLNLNFNKDIEIEPNQALKDLKNKESNK